MFSQPLPVWHYHGNLSAEFDASLQKQWMADGCVGSSGVHWNGIIMLELGSDTSAGAIPLQCHGCLWKCIDQQYWSQRWKDDNWSTLKFFEQAPPCKDSTFGKGHWHNFDMAIDQPLGAFRAAVISLGNGDSIRITIVFSGFIVREWMFTLPQRCHSMQIALNAGLDHAWIKLP
jgi:hypothetical protein